MQTRVHFIEELSRLNHDVLAMGTRVEESLRKALEALARDEAPRTGWVAALVAAFAAWTIGAGAFVALGVDASGRVVSRRGWPAAGVAAAGVGLWLVAIWRA